MRSIREVATLQWDIRNRVRCDEQSPAVINARISALLDTLLKYYWDEVGDGHSRIRLFFLVYY